MPRRTPHLIAAAALFFLLLVPACRSKKSPAATAATTTTTAARFARIPKIVPREVLEKIYHRNAEKLLGIKAVTW